jgi:hypothetical protein
MTGTSSWHVYNKATRKLMGDAKFQTSHLANTSAANCSVPFSFREDRLGFLVLTELRHGKRRDKADVKTSLLLRHKLELHYYTALSYEKEKNFVLNTSPWVSYKNGNISKESLLQRKVHSCSKQNKILRFKRILDVLCLNGEAKAICDSSLLFCL